MTSAMALAQPILPYPGIQQSMGPSPVKGKAPKGNHSANKLDPSDRPFHDWYRFVLSFPPHLVRRYLDDFGLNRNHKDTPSVSVLDPFCGTGTTLVEAKKNRIHAVGVEANPFARFSSVVKTDWSVSSDSLLNLANHVSETTLDALKKEGINDDWEFNGKVKDLPLKKLNGEAKKLLLTHSISPVPLHKSLTLLECLKKYHKEAGYNHMLLAFAKTLVFRISNLKFGPEVGVGKQKHDVPVVSSWLTEVQTMARDLSGLEGKDYPQCRVLLGDSRQVNDLLEPQSIDAVITSPPYPNEKDYSRTTRLESVILGFITNRGELRDFKKHLIRSNTRSVYKEDQDHLWVSKYKDIQRISDEIEQRRIQLGKTSGFERQYARLTRLYFGGMARHLYQLREVLRPGAQLAYVVGDQASYLRVMIRTGKLLSQIAEDAGYDVVRSDLFRTRFATATGEQLREEVVVLRWPGLKE